MNHYRSDNDLQDMHQDIHDTGSNDREISLGTSTVLGIFFALALICAVFFGFGYSMGRRSAQPPAGPADTGTATRSSTAKPTPDSLAAPTAREDTPPATDSPTTTSDAQPDSPADTSAEQPAKPATRPTPIARVSPPTATYVAATPGAATSVVQVAAVSHQEDANMLLSALRKRGYTVAIHQEPQDKLLHVQLGPFPTKKDADAMRQRLIADGYNAIVK